MALATNFSPELSVVLALHCGLMWVLADLCGLGKHITFVLSALSCIWVGPVRSKSDMCLSLSGVRGHRLRSDIDHQHKKFPRSSGVLHYA